MSSRVSSPFSKDLLTYDAVGVHSADEEAALGELGSWVKKTFGFSQIKPMLPLGFFANVLQLSDEIGLAISTDGVGTKLLVARALQRYDTVGIDCVAMNVNDVLCVGAVPVAMVDYIAVSTIEAAILGEIAKGLYKGAELAGINIPGGEIAQVRELLHENGQRFTFDLVGTCVGTVDPRRLVIGQNIEPGDLVVGIESSGIHSNGLTLARRALGLTGQDDVSRWRQYSSELGRTLGDELLTPTNIYVREVLAMLKAEIPLKALIHITGDGLLNLQRVASQIGYVIEHPLPPQPIFSLIQSCGNVDIAEMYRVFNMGIGFCVVCRPGDAPRVEQIARDHHRRAAVIGYAVQDSQRRVWLPSSRLVGLNGAFRVTTEKPPAYP